MEPESWSLVRHFQNYHFLRRPLCRSMFRQRSRSSFILYWGGPLEEAVLSLGQTPILLPSGTPGPPPPKKVFPQFLKILRGQGQNFDCVIRGPSRGVCDEILVTVSSPISPQKNPEFWRKSSISRVTRISVHVKKVMCMRPGPPYDTA